MMGVQQQNGLKRILTILSLVAVLLGLLGTFGNVFIKLGAAQERADNLEKAVVGLKAELVELTARQYNTEKNTYAIAVKLEVEKIIVPSERRK